VVIHTVTVCTDSVEKWVKLRHSGHTHVMEG
jgi:hypothetical protein